MALCLTRLPGQALTFTCPGVVLRVDILGVHSTQTQIAVNGRATCLRPGRPIALMPGVWLQMTAARGRQVSLACKAPDEVVIMRAELQVRHDVRRTDDGYRCSCGAGWPRHKGPDHPA